MNKKYSFAVIALLFLTGIVTSAVFIKLNGHDRNSVVLAKANVAEVSIKPVFNDGKPKLVYVESSNNRSTIWVTNPDDPTSSKEKIISITHLDGYPIKATLSPNNNFIAYTRVTKGANPSLDGTLWIFGIDGQTPTMLDKNIDYYHPPRWSLDGDSFVYIKIIPEARSKNGYSSELYIANTSGKKDRLFTDSESLAITPIGWSSDGSSIFIDRIESDGDSIYEIDSNSGAVQFIAHLSSSAAWNLSLSPDGENILGSILNDSKTLSYSIISVSTHTGKVEKLITGASFHYTPIWDSTTITTNIPNSGKNGVSKIAQISSQQNPIVTAMQLQWPNLYNGVPLAWSPDHQWLAVELYSNSSMQIAVMQDGNTTINAFGQPDWTQFIGWLK